MLCTEAVKTIRTDAALGCYDSACILRDLYVETGNPLWMLWDKIVDELFSHELAKKFPILTTKFNVYQTSGWCDRDILDGCDDEWCFTWFESADEALEAIETYWTENIR